MQYDAATGQRYQVNDQGGYDILLEGPLTQSAIAPGTDTAAPATPAPPDMGGGIGSDAAANQAPADAGWVGDVVKGAGTGNTLEGAQNMVTPAAPDMGGTRGGKWGDMAAGFAGGMNTIDRNQSPLAGFAAGMSGAMSAREDRRKGKRAEMLQDEDRAIKAGELKYQHGRDTVEDTRNARRDALLERADQRAGKTAELNNIEAGLKLDTAQMALDKSRADAKADLYGMGAVEKEAADKAVDAAMETLGKAFALDPADSDEQMKEKAARYLQIKEDVRAREYAKYAVDNSSHENPPGTAKPSDVDPSKPGVTAATALSWPQGQAPASQGEMEAILEAAVAANNGNPVYVRNPKNPSEIRLYESKRSR